MILQPTCKNTVPCSWPKNPWSQFQTLPTTGGTAWLILAPAQQQCEISYCLRIRPVQTLNISFANQNILQGRTVAHPEITEVKWAMKRQKQQDSSVPQQDFINHFGLAILKAHIASNISGSGVDSHQKGHILQPNILWARLFTCPEVVVTNGTNTSAEWHVILAHASFQPHHETNSL